MGILSLLLWTPAIGALLLAITPSRNSLLIRLTAQLCSALALALSLLLLSRYDLHDAGLQFSETIPLKPGLGSAYALAVDGLSMPMLVLTTVLTSASLLISDDVDSSVKGYFICILLLEWGLIGVFSAQDWGLFYIFWQLTLIPLFFLINRWGGQRRQAASLRFALYALAGSAFMLLSLLAINQHDPKFSGLTMTSLNQAAQAMPHAKQTLALLGFLIGFGGNMALFPWHGWLPLAHAAAPGPSNLLLSGVLLKIGAYGLLRAVTMLPQAAQSLQPVLIFLALFGMVHGSLLAWRQSELKAMLAYWSIGQMAVILAGIASLNSIGLNGAVLQMTAHGLIAGALFLLLHLLQRRTGTLDLQNNAALLTTMPRFALLLVATLLAAMAMPGTAGFIAAIHVLIGGFQQWQGLMVFFLLAGLITGASSLRAISLLCIGGEQPNSAPPKDLRPGEWAIAGAFALAIVLLGLLPAWWLELSADTVTRLGHAAGFQGF